MLMKVSRSHNLLSACKQANKDITVKNSQKTPLLETKCVKEIIWKH